MPAAIEEGAAEARQPQPEPREAARPGCGNAPAITLARVMEAAEWAEVHARRHAANTGDAGDAGGPGAAPRDLAGLALSGGGIRSATFNLGLLQGMRKRKVLRVFDYLSTVSGGGYVGGWWSAWISRDKRAEERAAASAEAAREMTFPPPEKREPHRWTMYAPPRAMPGDEAGANARAMPDASLSAHDNDPVHHLRLFANYLTPRKGALSGDTWRAGTIVVRNLLLTWLVLLPLLLAAVLAGQLYFTLHPSPESNFLREFTVERKEPPAVEARAAPAADALADAVAAREMEARAGAAAERKVRGERLAAIAERARIAARPLLVLLIWTVVLTLLWLLYGPGGAFTHQLFTLVGTAAAVGIAYAMYQVFKDSSGPSLLTRGWLVVAAAGGAAMFIAFWAVPAARDVWEWAPRFGRRVQGKLPGGASRAEADDAAREDGAAEAEAATRADVRRNRVVRVHAAVLVTLGITAAVLLVAGFSHDLVWFLFDPASGGPLPTWAKRAGGWAAVAATVGSMVFTGIKGAPTGGDGDAHAQPGLASRVVFGAAPVLAVTLLAVLAATGGRSAIQALGARSGDLRWVSLALGVSVALLLLFALFEMVDPDDGIPWWRQAVVTAAALAAGGAVLAAARGWGTLTLRDALYWVGGAGALLAVRWTGYRTRAEEAAARAGAKAARPPLRRALAGALLAMGAVGLAAPFFHASEYAALREVWMRQRELLQEQPRTAPLLLAGIAFCAALALAEHFVAHSRRRRAMGLVTSAFVALAARLAIPLLPLGVGAILHSSAAVALMVFALAWVVGLGWMADPNLTSLHAFYKARLVRAYMGASNTRRRSQEITEAAAGDDLPIHTLRNCERGAPYHLVNTTLNLVGGRDLATAQRSADSFLLSKHYCGSARTGYRPTCEYMSGRLSLGTAVAVSGAAASANMGSKTPSAALAMLMAFLNVRLAYWAPTPNRARWKDPQPRLWPFYLLREFLSQTNDLSAYCCLSDGGHFDNTGMHALVARGCRYIVVSDCGADPRPCFEDVGNAIRRCRIDFGAEIRLMVDAFVPSEKKVAGTHVVVGSIEYDAGHLRALGWSDEEIEEGRTGVVIWIKPSLTGTDETADVRQYAIENGAFPQQTTADQWFDEAQFESYRALGEHIAEQVFAAGPTFAELPVEEAAKKLFDRLRNPKPAVKLHFKVGVVDVGGKPTLQVVQEKVTWRRALGIRRTIKRPAGAPGGKHP